MIRNLQFAAVDKEKASIADLRELTEKKNKFPLGVLF